MNANALLWVNHDTNALMQTQIIQNSLYFQNEASSALEIKVFSKLDLLFLKSHLLFNLRLPKKLMITVRISEWNIDLEFDDLAQKVYFHNWGEQKGWHIFNAFFWKPEVKRKMTFQE